MKNADGKESEAIDGSKPDYTWGNVADIYLKAFGYNNDNNKCSYTSGKGWNVPIDLINNKILALTNDTNLNIHKILFMIDTSKENPTVIHNTIDKIISNAEENKENEINQQWNDALKDAEITDTTGNDVTISGTDDITKAIETIQQNAIAKQDVEVVLVEYFVNGLAKKNGYSGTPIKITKDSNQNLIFNPSEITLSNEAKYSLLYDNQKIKIELQPFFTLNIDNDQIQWKTFLQFVMQLLNINDYKLQDGDIIVNDNKWYIKDNLQKYFVLDNTQQQLTLTNDTKSFVINVSQQVTYKTLLELIFAKLGISATFDNDTIELAGKEYYSFEINDTNKLSQLDPYFTLYHDNKILPVTELGACYADQFSQYCNTIPNNKDNVAKLKEDFNKILKKLNITTINIEWDDNTNVIAKKSTWYIWEKKPFKIFNNNLKISDDQTLITIYNQDTKYFKVPAYTNPTGLDLVNICCLFNGEKEMQYNPGDQYKNKISYNNNEYEIQYNKFKTVLPEIKNNILNIYKFDQFHSKEFKFTNINNLTTYVNDMNNYCEHIGYSGKQKFSFDLYGYILSSVTTNKQIITGIIRTLTGQKTINESSEVTIPNDLNNDGIFIRTDNSNTTTIIHRNFIIDRETLFSYIKDYC